MRLWALENAILQKAFDGTEYINSPEDIFDESLVKRNGWLMYGESKQDIPAYQLYKVYVLNTLTGSITEQSIKDYTPRTLMELLSIRYNIQKGLSSEHENPKTAEEFHALLGRSATPKTPVLRSAVAAATAAAANPDLLELEPVVANYLAPPQSERDMALIRRLVLECLSESRADAYSTWRETEWCLRNINDSEDMFRLWIEFSQKSPKAGGINVEREYREWRRGSSMSLSGKKLTKRSLHYWAREDNPQKYNEIIKSDLVEWVSHGGCKNTHNHIAQLMSLLYDGDYRVAMDSKRVTWYYYNKNVWETIVQGVELRMKLSSEIVDIITEGRKARRQWLQQMGNEEFGTDLIFKELLGIEKNLYSCAFKNSVMQEAANTFYERDFEKKLNSATNLVGCANCVIDLRAERIRPDGTTELYVQVRDPKPDDYISFLAGNNPPDMEPIVYIPFSEIGFDDPEIKEIMDFFAKVFPRPELREFMLVLSASCLEGVNREQAFYFNIGSGGNAKSKYEALMQFTLGDYYTSLTSTALTRKRPDSGAANPELIVCRNKRTLFIQEPDPNEAINTSIMKQFSGEDNVNVRGLYQDQDSFKIQGKCFISSNKFPAINQTDGGAWRRPRVIMFESRFVDHGDTTYDPSKNVYYKDYNLDAKLKKWRTKFFSLLVYYYETRYLKGGLVPPPIVMQVVNNYKYSHDSFAKFFDSCVRKNPEADDITIARIYKIYNNWYINLSGTSAVKIKLEEFKTRLEEKLNTTITKNVRGIEVFASEEDADKFDKESDGGSVLGEEGAAQT
jgi:phage/plasmid-associated DNA primase